MKRRHHRQVEDDDAGLAPVEKKVLQVGREPPVGDCTDDDRGQQVNKDEACGDNPRVASDLSRHCPHHDGDRDDINAQEIDEQEGHSENPGLDPVGEPMHDGGLGQAMQPSSNTAAIQPGRSGECSVTGVFAWRKFSAKSVCTRYRRFAAPCTPRALPHRPSWRPGQVVPRECPGPVAADAPASVLLMVRPSFCYRTRATAVLFPMVSCGRESLGHSG